MNLLSKIINFFATFTLCTAVLANPVLSNVGAGNVSISHTPNVTTVNQASQKAVINWSSFNISKGQATHFNQPQGGIALNRISASQGASQIYGMLTATGKIILINSAGIFFGPSAYVNVGGLIASTANLSNQDFLKGNYHFTPVPGEGAIDNAGKIIAHENGLVALIGNGVSNSGLIEANLGKVVLASGTAFTMNFAGNDLVNFKVKGPSSQSVTNTGKLMANGGEVLVTAEAASGVLDNSINMQGVAIANSVGNQNGEIILSSNGNVSVSGKLSAAGKQAGTTGGTVEITGNNILLNSPTLINVSGNAGGGHIQIGRDNAGNLAQSTTIADGVTLLASSTNGNGGLIETSGDYLQLGNINVNTTAPNGMMGDWLLDPDSINIVSNGGSNSNITGTGCTGSPSCTFTVTTNSTPSTLDVGILESNLGTSNVTVQSGASGVIAGNITVSSGITWTAATTLELEAVVGDITINAPISATNGSLELSAANTASSITTGASGTINVANFNLLAGQWNQVGTLPSFAVSNSFAITSGAQFIRAEGGNGTSGSPYEITDIYGLQGIGSSPLTETENYVIENTINASGTSTWNSGAGFVPFNLSGTLNGNNESIENLTINLPTTSNVGLIGVLNTSGSLTNIVLTNETVTGNSDVGGLVGDAIAGSISGGSVSGTITGNGNSVGGLVGRDTVNINGATASSVTVSGTTDVGGLVGEETSTAVTINGSSTSGSVTATAASGSAGGLIGFDAGNVTNSSSSATVQGTEFVGGLIGEVTFAAATPINISNDTTSGTVTGTGAGLDVGGLIGFNEAPVSSSFSSSSVSGVSDVGGLIGDNSGTVNGSTGSITGCTGYSVCSIGTVTATGNNTGGLIGLNSGTINSVYSTSNVTGEGNTGGLIGDNTGASVSDAYSTGTVTNTTEIANTGTGGLIGSFSGTINDVYTSSSLTVIGNAGGLIGQSLSNITDTTTSYGICAGTSMCATGTINAAAASPGAFGGLFGSLVGIEISDFPASATSSVTLNTANATGVGGLVGSISGPGVISNSSTSEAVTGLNHVGGLVGTLSNTTSTVENSNSSSMVTAATGNVGGLVGDSHGIVMNSYSTGTVTTTGVAGSVGGLVGINFGGVGSTGIISGSYSTSQVIGVNATGLGGLVGDNAGGTITQSYSTGNVTGESEAGGLIGSNSAASTVSDVYSTGNVSGNGFVGGLIGINAGNFNGAGSYGICGTSSICATGTVTGTGNGQAYFGGLMGNSSGNVSNVYYTAAPVDVPNAIEVGGLTGETTGPISNAYSTVAVTGQSYVGGLVGGLYMPTGSVTNSYSTGTVSGSGSYIGGLVGENNEATLSNSFATGNVFGTLSTTFDVGGLAGLNENGAQISATYSTGNVSSTGSDVGGFIGSNQTSSTITGSYSTGSASGNTDVGGFAGNNLSSSTITNSYSLGSASGNTDIGGFVGLNSGTIDPSYSLGTVSGTTDVGGFVGENSGSINESYSHSNVTGATNVGGFAGINDAGGVINIAYSIGQVTGSNNTGGFIGDNNGSITNAFSDGAVSGGAVTGGFVGLNTGSIGDVYSTGLVKGSSNSGGLVGSNSGSVTSSYWDVQTSQIGSSAAGTGLLTSAMINPSSYVGWNFNTIWATQNGSFPFLIAIPYILIPNISVADDEGASSSVAAILQQAVANQPIDIDDSWLTIGSELDQLVLDQKQCFSVNPNGTNLSINITCQCYALKDKTQKTGIKWQCTGHPPPANQAHIINANGAATMQTKVSLK